MKIKKKLSAKIVLFFFLFSNFFSLLSPVVVFAAATRQGSTDIYLDNPVATGVVLTIQFKGFLPINYGKEPTDAGWDPFVAKHSPNEGNIIYAQLYETSDGSNTLSCSADKRMVTSLMPEGFCENLHKTCTPEYVAGSPTDLVTTTVNPDNDCFKTNAIIWANELKVILQDEWDALLKENGLDSEKSNEIIQGCGANPVCIERTIENLIASGNYYEGGATNNSRNEPLTPGSLSDLINSDRNNPPDLGPVNTGANDLGGLAGKTKGPSVDVLFNSSGAMQTGAKVTATAIPSSFNSASDLKSLYFTWYLKRKDCDLSDDVNDVNKACDLDDNNRITENDWKIAAAKIMVASSFDSTGANYSNFPNGMDAESSAHVAIPEFSRKDPEDEDEIIEVWRKGFLRDNDGEIYSDNDGDVENCYVQAPKSGLFYELRKTVPVFKINSEEKDDYGCPTGYHAACVSDQTADCEKINPLFSQTDKDAAASAVPPLPYSISKGIFDASTKFTACAVSSEKTATTVPDASCKISDVENFEARIKCTKEGELPICVKDENKNTDFLNRANNLIGTIIGGDVSSKNDKMCSAVAMADTENEGYFFDNTDQRLDKDMELCSSVTDKLINGTKTEDGDVDVAGKSNLAPKCAFEKSANLCKHLFPVLPEEITKDNGDQAVSGDGEFNLKEKQFWGADPTKIATIGEGKDEEKIVGLGMDKFEWLFSAGDQVGVVVEGDSDVPSEHNDSSYKRMWAFSKGFCSVLEKIEEDTGENTRGFYIEGSKGILTTDVDLNDCLEENLLEPDAESGYGLSVNLDAMPENPINDPNGKGDILNIVSGTANTQDAQGLLYKWSVQKSLSGSTAPIDTTNWKDITTDLESRSFSANDIEGLDKKNLAINLNIEDPATIGSVMQMPYNGVFYLRIRLRITGTAADGNQDSLGEVIVRIKQQENEMRIYPVSATADGMLKLSTNDSAERCSDSRGKTACSVTKNEIIGVTIPSTANSGETPFSWKINGNDIVCSSSISTECADGNNLFFPILGNIGEAVDVVARGLNKNGEPIEVSRHFVIVAPELKIESFDANAWPKLMGYYKDLNSEGSCIQGGVGCYADLSTAVLETTEGATVTLGTVSGVGLEWAIDGQIIPEYKDKDQIQISIDKMVGESYNVGVSTYLLPGNTSQINSIRRALYKNWGIAPEEATEENRSANIQLDVIAGNSQTVASAEKNGFGASLITHLPEQLLFLFKISLTSALVMFVAGLLFAFIPETIFKKGQQSL